MNTVDVAVRGVRAPRWLPGLAARCRRALAAAGIDGWDLSVLLTGDAGIRALNRRYRGKDRATDVLSFPQTEGPRVPRQRGTAAVAAGDIAISVPTLRRAARDRGAPEEEELERLLVHGILHLDGMDHGPGKGTAMAERERRVLRGLARGTAARGTAARGGGGAS